LTPVIGEMELASPGRTFVGLWVVRWPRVTSISVRRASRQAPGARCPRTSPTRQPDKPGVDDATPFLIKAAVASLCRVTTRQTPDTPDRCRRGRGSMCRVVG